MDDPNGEYFDLEYHGYRVLGGPNVMGSVVWVIGPDGSEYYAASKQDALAYVDVDRTFTGASL